jgi:phage/plasmid-like protein (TIGR03299 family)
MTNECHEIEQYTDGTGSAVYYREAAWHQLGIVTTERLTVDEALIAARANYEVIKAEEPASLLTPHGIVADDTKRIIYRVHPDTGEAQALGTVGADYEVFQNREAFRAVDYILQDSSGKVESAAVMRDGKRVFLTVRFPEDILVGGTDRIAQYLMVTTSHDGSMALTFANTNIRVVCANTHRMALSEATQKITRKHTRNMRQVLEQARTALQISQKYRAAYQETADRLLDTTCTDAQFEQIVAQLYKPKQDEPTKRTAVLWEKKSERLQWLFAEADTQANIRGTGWAAFNALGEYCDWYKTIKGVDAAGTTADAARFARSIEGGLDAEKDDALRVVRKVLQVA